MDTININGVTYYKLEDIYPGDITKHCSLKTEELDQNFHILRGLDIESVAFSNNKLILKRLNGSYLYVNIDETPSITTDNLNFEYNSENGSLKITYPDGEEAVISGFTTSIYTDDTFDGDGSVNNPLKLSRHAKTGFYAPADEYIELLHGESLPTEGIELGYRIVTKEIKNNFGKLYNINGLEIISEYLEDTGSEWRIPTKHDWDKLLDSLEPEGYVDVEHGFLPHSSTTLGYLGKYAAQHLKSEYFKYNENQIEEDSTCGYNTIEFNIIPVGTAFKDEYDIITHEGFFENSFFWSIDDYEEGKYTKGFKFNTNKVPQEKYNEKFLSIRLVKDYNGNNYKGDEGIFGQTYPTILNEKTSQIWTSINVSATKTQIELLTNGINYTDIVVDEHDTDLVSIEEAFYINEFDGKKWIKKELKEGESIVIFSMDEEDGITAYYRRWVVKNGELKSYENYANEKINGLIEDLDIFIHENLETIIKNTVKSYLDETMNEIKITETEDGKLKIGFSDNAIFG